MSSLNVEAQKSAPKSATPKSANGGAPTKTPTGSAGTPKLPVGSAVPPKTLGGVVSFQP